MVNKPFKHIAKTENAAHCSLICIALEAPIAWEAIPSDKPLLISCFIANMENNGVAIAAPIMPLIMTKITAIEGIPPTSLVISMAMGEVIDLLTMLKSSELSTLNNQSNNNAEQGDIIAPNNEGKRIVLL